MSDRYDGAAARLAKTVAGVRALHAALDFAERAEALDDEDRRAAREVIECVAATLTDDRSPDARPKPVIPPPRGSGSPPASR